MKSERRHELDNNELLDWLSNLGQSIKPHVNLIILGLCIAAVIIFAINWKTGDSQAQLAESSNLLVANYNKVQQGGGPEELDRVANAYPDTGAGVIAMVVAADIRLGQGIDNISVDKDVAAEDIDSAIKGYERVLKSTSDPILRERARYGLGQAQETLGQADAAKKQYESLVKEFPEGTFTETARSRLIALEQPSMVAFFDEFNKFDPKAVVEQPEGSDTPLSPSGLMNSGGADTLPDSPSATFGEGLQDPGTSSMPMIGPSAPTTDVPVAPVTETPASATDGQ